MRHAIGHELTIADKFGARVVVQSHILQSIKTCEYFKLIPTNNQILVKLKTLKFIKSLQFVHVREKVNAITR